MQRNILLLVSSMGCGGAERVAAVLANAWAARGDVVTLVPTFSGRGECFYSLADDVDLVYLADLSGRVGRSPLAYYSRFRALRRLVMELRPDVVVSFLTNVNIAAVLATLGLKIPVVVCERSNPQFEDTIGHGLRWARRRVYPLADAVTVQGQEMVEAFERMVPGMKRVAVIPNPLPRTLESRLRVRASGTPERLCLVAMGRLSHEKQFAGLISCFATLAPEFPEWELRIWGEGPQRAVLEEQVLLLGLEGRVYLPGTTTVPWDELAKGTAFVLSSAYEGFPNVLLEAMALGLPCVAFDCPSGPRALTVGGEHGLLVPAGDWAALTDALRVIMSDILLRDALGTLAAASVRRRYGLDQVLTIWDALLTSLPRQTKVEQ